MNFLIGYYLWLKVVHLIAIIGWMVGILYLPRLFAYHADASVGSDTDAVFQQMAYNLMRLLIMPCMIVVFITGILLIVATESLANGWLHTKILLVLMLAGLHGMMSRQRKNFQRGENAKSAAYFRTFSHVTTLIVILVVALAVLKPF